MRTRMIVGAVALVVGCGSFVQASEVSVVMKDGRVTVVAENAPVRQILAEWARVGQTKIMGADRLAGPPVTLQLLDVPEEQALETLLRSASGYMAAPRPQPLADASLYDRILILPTSTAPPATAGPTGRSNVPGPVMAPRQPPMRVPPQQPAEEEEVVDDPGDDPVEGDEPDPEETPAMNPYGGSGTGFDYSNPELELQRRMRDARRNPPPTTSATPGTVIQNPAQAPPSVFPGTAMPPVPGQTQQSPTSARPGEIVAPPQQGANPYGLPPGIQPGSVVGPAVQPDRSKYTNPYQPTPIKPPERQ